jgi:hypothetical protein
VSCQQDVREAQYVRGVGPAALPERNGGGAFIVNLVKQLARTGEIEYQSVDT